MSGTIDVDIYLSNIKSFLEKNTDAAAYFYGKNGEDMFYELVSIFAHENFEKNDDPALSMSQFEEIRQAIIVRFGTKSISDIMGTFPFSLN